MFGDLGLHVIKNPAGTYSFVGRIPTDLGDIVPATYQDIMAGRSWRDSNGESVTVKFPVFNSEYEAIEYALEHGHKVIED